MKLAISLLLAVIVTPVVGAADQRPSGGPEHPLWREITSATDTSDFKLNCEYYAIFEYVPGADRALFLNFIGLGETGHPGVSSFVSADASGAQNFRIENTEKDTVKFADESFPARVFERCYRRLPAAVSE